MATRKPAAKPIDPLSDPQDQPINATGNGSRVDRRDLFKLAAYAAPMTVVLLDAEHARAIGGCSLVGEPGDDVPCYDE